jgi:hypothetical protein
MRPELPFDRQYRRLIQSLCMSPELSARQLEQIFARFYTGKSPPGREAGARSGKGGSPCA